MVCLLGAACIPDDALLKELKNLGVDAVICGGLAANETPAKPPLPVLGAKTGLDSVAKLELTFAADGSVSSVLLNVTDGEKLSTALAEAGIISQEEADAGFVTTVNGETADYDKDQAWWCLTDAAGEMTTVGVADIELHDGDSYAFTYTKG